ncbi:hypothetical protein H1C71_035260, partial [Ictidomys tridecemlineatus]
LLGRASQREHRSWSLKGLEGGGDQERKSRLGRTDHWLRAQASVSSFIEWTQGLVKTGLLHGEVGTTKLPRSALRSWTLEAGTTDRFAAPELRTGVLGKGTGPSRGTSRVTRGAASLPGGKGDPDIFRWEGEADLH